MILIKFRNRIGGNFMLLIQTINLMWHKMERGAEGEKARRHFPFTYPLEEKQFQEDVMVQGLNFYQNGADFMDFRQAERYYSEKNLPQCGYTPERIQREIQNNIIWIKKHQYQFYASIDALNLTNLSICHRENLLEATFFYDEHRSGRPFRRGHNKDFQNPDSPFYRKDNLNEIAFVLMPNQYGRIIWNERRIDYDNGTWYYQLHIYNLFYSPERTYTKDIFMNKKPDAEYTQLGSLF